jgi:hypothetical protein
MIKPDFDLMHKFPNVIENYVEHYHLIQKSKSFYLLNKSKTYKTSLSVKTISVDCLSIDFIFVSIISHPIRAKQKTEHFFCSRIIFINY